MIVNLKPDGICSRCAIYGHKHSGFPCPNIVDISDIEEAHYTTFWSLKVACV